MLKKAMKLVADIEVIGDDLVRKKAIIVKLYHASKISLKKLQTQHPHLQALHPDQVWVWTRDLEVKKAWAEYHCLNRIDGKMPLGWMVFAPEPDTYVKKS